MHRRQAMIGLGLLAIVVLAVFALRLSGYSLRVGVAREDVRTYVYEKEPRFSFRYDAKVFALDEDEAKRYGVTYAIGVKVHDDARTGCEVRVFDQKLELGDDPDKAAQALSREMSGGTSDVSTTSSFFTRISGKKALSMQLNLLGPLGDALVIHQAFIPDGDRTVALFCGGNKSVERFYQADYDRFFDSFDLR